MEVCQGPDSANHGDKSLALAGPANHVTRDVSAGGALDGAAIAELDVQDWE